MALSIKKGAANAPAPNPQKKPRTKKAAVVASFDWEGVKEGALIESLALFPHISDEQAVLLVSENSPHPSIDGARRLILRLYWHDVLVRILRCTVKGGAITMETAV